MLIPTAAQAGCSPAGNSIAQVITCSATIPENAPFSAEGGNDTIDILSGVFAGDISGGTGSDRITMDGGSVTGSLLGGTFNDNGFSFVLGDVFYGQNANWQINTLGGIIQLQYVGPNQTVPAPGTLGLLGAGVAGVALLRRRRKTKT